MNLNSATRLTLGKSGAERVKGIYDKMKNL